MGTGLEKEPFVKKFGSDEEVGQWGEQGSHIYLRHIILIIKNCLVHKWVHRPISPGRGGIDPEPIAVVLGGAEVELFILLDHSDPIALIPRQVVCRDQPRHAAAHNHNFFIPVLQLF